MYINYYNVNLVPFAYGPENLDSREIVQYDENGFSIKFDMTSERFTPECAAVAIQLTDTIVPEKLNVNIELVSGDIPCIFIETKHMVSGTLQKYGLDRKYPLTLNETIQISMPLRPSTTEIVFCLWRAQCDGHKGVIKITNR